MEEHVSVGKVGVGAVKCSRNDSVCVVEVTVVVKELLEIREVRSAGVVAGTHARVGIGRESLECASIVVVGCDDVAVVDGRGNVVNDEGARGNQTCQGREKTAEFTLL